MANQKATLGNVSNEGMALSRIRPLENETCTQYVQVVSENGMFIVDPVYAFSDTKVLGKPRVHRSIEVGSEELTVNATGNKSGGNAATYTASSEETGLVYLPSKGACQFVVDLINNDKSIEAYVVAKADHDKSTTPVVHSKAKVLKIISVTTRNENEFSQEFVSLKSEPIKDAKKGTEMKKKKVKETV